MKVDQAFSHADSNSAEPTFVKSSHVSSFHATLDVAACVVVQYKVHVFLSFDEFDAFNDRGVFASVEIRSFVPHICKMKCCPLAFVPLVDHLDGKGLTNHLVLGEAERCEATALEVTLISVVGKLVLVERRVEPLKLQYVSILLFTKFVT